MTRERLASLANNTVRTRVRLGYFYIFVFYTLEPLVCLFVCVFLFFLSVTLSYYMSLPLQVHFIISLSFLFCFCFFVCFLFRFFFFVCLLCISWF